MKKVIFATFFVLSLCLVADAQEEVKKKTFKSGIEAGTSFSFTGFNVNLAYALAWKDNTIFAGPKLTMTDSYLPSKGPWGIHAGYRRQLPGNKKLKAFAALEYEVVFLKPFNPHNLDIKGSNEIHELYFSYGLQYAVLKNVVIGNSIGAGFYYERFIDAVLGNRTSYSGYSGLLRLFVQYSF